LGRALEKYRLAWLEDVISWEYTDQWKKLSDALETPCLTGEDIYLLKNFKPLIDARAVDIIHPDLASSGGLLETKRIGDYAKRMELLWPCTRRARPFLLWRMYIVQRPHKISWLWNIIQLTCHGGKI
jgi:L-alanine-DL-glutamate epimerase-like enolase superfamily enzyme